MPLGTYVQAYEDHQIKNDNKARTIDAIYLRAKPKSGHELMNLETGGLITRSRFWEMPITPLLSEQWKKWPTARVSSHLR